MGKKASSDLLGTIELTRLKSLHALARTHGSGLKEGGHCMLTMNGAPYGVMVPVDFVEESQRQVMNLGTRPITYPQLARMMQSGEKLDERTVHTYKPAGHPGCAIVSCEIFRTALELRQPARAASTRDRALTAEDFCGEAGRKRLCQLNGQPPGGRMLPVRTTAGQVLVSAFRGQAAAILLAMEQERRPIGRASLDDVLAEPGSVLKQAAREPLKIVDGAFNTVVAVCIPETAVNGSAAAGEVPARRTVPSKQPMP